MSQLFSPLAIGPLSLPNRIVVAPMCQYSSIDGEASDWHVQHWSNLALSGAGLVIVEATAVEPRGRISWADLGLYDDATEAAFANALATVRRWSPAKMGVQLAHAGRKASTLKPWEAGGGPIPADDARGWTTRAPSALPYAETDPVPEALDDAGIAEIIQAFTDSAIARGATRLGPHRNTCGARLPAARIPVAAEQPAERTNLAARSKTACGWCCRCSVRSRRWCRSRWRWASASPPPTGSRVAGIVEQSLALAKALDARGCHFIHVSSGGLHPAQKIASGSRLPVAVRRGDQARGRDAGDRGGHDHRAATGGSGAGRWPSRRRRAGHGRCCSIRAGRGVPPPSWARRSRRRRSTCAVRRTGQSKLLQIATGSAG
jgi:2,4-dienoyl-CoA reductase-like NADH-dependent reductase (Old Yellow Enzyme family)